MWYNEPMNEISFDSRPATRKHIGQVRALIGRIADELLRRSRVHDKTKLEEPELSGWNANVWKLDTLDYGTEEYRAALRDIYPTIQHHYEHNDHHPEFHENGIEDMDLVQLTEMICDWKAATLRMKNPDIHGSIDKNAERFGYGPELTRILHLTVDRYLED
jgi:hypothetical protein